MVTEVGSDTARPVTVKLALNCPDGTVTVPGTLATDELELESVTTTPPEPAGWPTFTVPCPVFPPETLLALSVKEVSVCAVVDTTTETPADGISRLPLSSVARRRIV